MLPRAAAVAIAPRVRSRGRGFVCLVRLTLGDRVQKLHRRNLQAVDQRRGLGLEKHVRQQQGDGDEQARCRVVHATEMAAASKLAFSAGLAVATALKAPMSR